MYGLPKNIDLSFLKGCQLMQICISSFQVQFHFDSRIKIFVTSPFQFVNKKGVTNEISNAPASGLIVEQLINCIISTVQSSTNGTLQINFECGSKLIFYDNNKAYECYEIRDGDKVIAV